MSIGTIIFIAFVWIIATAIHCAVSLSGDCQRGRERAAKEAADKSSK